LNTWVADITLHKRLGKFIHKFKSKDGVVSKLRKARARMKMFAEDTPYTKGPNIQKYTKAEQEMIKYGAYLDKMQEEMYKNSYALKKSDTGDADVEAGNKKLYFENFIEKMDAPVVAAFVVFQYSESMARCVEDYALFSQFPFSLCYPSRLKFRGHRIGVVKAPEPDERVWENIEAKDLRQIYLAGCPSPSSSLLFKAELLKKWGWNEDMNIADDWCLLLDIILNEPTKAAYNTETLWTKNVNGDNIYDGRNKLEVLRLLGKDKSNLLKKNRSLLSPTEIKFLEKEYILNLMSVSKETLKKEKNIKKSLSYILKAYFAFEFKFLHFYIFNQILNLKLLFNFHI
jgi:hypothetical protein